MTFNSLNQLLLQQSHFNGNNASAFCSNNNKKTVSKKRVRFNDKNLEKHYESSSCIITIDECNRLWNTQEEMKEFQQERYEVVTAARSSCNNIQALPLNNNDLCTWGCELFIDGDGIHDIRQRHNQIVTMVIQEQSNQRLCGMHNPQSIQMISSMCSNYSRHRAQQIALNVAMEVKTMNNGTTSRSASSTKTKNSKLVAVLSQSIDCLSGSDSVSSSIDDELEPANALFENIMKRNSNAKRSSSRPSFLTSIQRNQPSNLSPFSNARTDMILREAVLVVQKETGDQSRPTKRVRHHPTATASIQKNTVGNKEDASTQLSLRALLANSRRSNFVV